MADTFNIYKGKDKVLSGGAKQTITGVGPNKDVAKGTYQATRISEDGVESVKVDLPAFKTKPIAVTGVKLDKTTIAGKLGDKGKLTATVAPSNATNKGFTFTSSDSAVIKVDNSGNWEMLKDGTADLTAKTTDGGKTAVCKGTVKTPEPEPEPEPEG